MRVLYHHNWPNDTTQKEIGVILEAIGTQEISASVEEQTASVEEVASSADELSRMV